jgi:predicted hotdog family 3-hydroxylacyl-ACP dehydratase
MEKPDIADLLPHASPMLLLDDLIECSNDSITCSLKVRSDALFEKDELVPAWLGIEYMAQSIGAYSGYRRRLHNLPIKVGFLLGTRRFSTNVPEFSVGQTLLVIAKKAIETGNGMASFDCKVEGEGVLQTAFLSVFEPEDSLAMEMLKEAGV